jgi:hypothetical protein
MAVREKDSTPLYVPASFTNGNGSRLAPPKRKRGGRFWAGVILAAVLVVAWVAVAAFFVGQGTRPSDAQVHDRIADRVASERAAAGKRRARALDRQEAVLDRRWRAQMRRNTKRAYGDGRANGYRAGRSAGYAAGAAAGRAEGERRGRAKGRRQARRASYGDAYGGPRCFDADVYAFFC